MITFLTSPKDFTGQVGLHQETAITSWLALEPNVEVFVYGGATGAADLCNRLGIRHCPDVACSSSGAPHFDAVAHHAERYARHDFQVFVNCDIMFTSSVLDVARSEALSRIGTFLVVGQRLDLAEGVVPNVKGNWHEQLLAFAKQGQVAVHPATGKDYFMFPRGLWHNVPRITVGRGSYDDVLLAHCIRHGVTLIDATRAVPAMHLWHQYGHVAGGREEVWRGEEARANRSAFREVALGGPWASDARLRFDPGASGMSRSAQSWVRALELWLRFRVRAGAASMLVKAARILLDGRRPPGVRLEDLLDDYGTRVPISTISAGTR